jgi:hypothetical protein
VLDVVVVVGRVVDVEVVVLDVVLVVGRVVDVEVDVLDVVLVVGRVVDVEVDVLDVVVDGGRVVDVVDVAAEASASMRPKPLASSNPGAPMSTAPRVKTACTCAGVSVGSGRGATRRHPRMRRGGRRAEEGRTAGRPEATGVRGATPSNATRSGLARISSCGKSMARVRAS